MVWAVSRRAGFNRKLVCEDGQSLAANNSPVCDRSRWVREFVVLAAESSQALLRPVRPIVEMFRHRGCVLPSQCSNIRVQFFHVGNCCPFWPLLATA